MTGDPASWLAADLVRLKSAEPHVVLGIPAGADAAVVRNAYLSLTKRYHPNRFALETSSVRDLASEVFLLIRRAYDLLHRGSGARVSSPPQPAPQPQAQPVTATPSRTTATRRIETPFEVSESPRPAPPSRPVSGTPASVPALTPPPAAPRPPAPAQPQTPTPASRPAAAAGKTPEEVQALLEAAKTRNTRYEDALRLIARGRYREAREALHALATEDAQSKRFRAALSLAWGLEHLQEGKLDDAHRELDRAAALDPDNPDVQAALKKLAEQRKKGGLLGKLFGK
jgi:tetratricopeptide (TPR) repeat protein